MAIGGWVRGIQDAMPDTTRNSDPWKALLPIAAGTGRAPADERRRLDLIMEWMWTTVLPCVQPVADMHGFGEEWRRMTTTKTAYAARGVANDAARAAASRAAAADAAYLAADHVGSYAARAAAYATADAAAAWETFDPPGLLARLIAVTGDNDA